MRGSGWRWDIPICGEACAHWHCRCNRHSGRTCIPATCLSSGDEADLCARSCGMTGLLCPYTSAAWSGGGSSGRQQRKEQWRSRPRHWHVCSKGSTGARRRKPGARHRLVDALSPHSGAFLKGEMALKMAKMLEF